MLVLATESVAPVHLGFHDQPAAFERAARAAMAFLAAPGLLLARWEQARFPC